MESKKMNPIQPYMRTLSAVLRDLSGVIREQHDNGNRVILYLDTTTSTTSLTTPGTIGFALDEKTQQLYDSYPIEEQVPVMIRYFQNGPGSELLGMSFCVQLPPRRPDTGRPS